MPERNLVNTEAELWDRVVESQEGYARSLARLDDRALNLAAGNPSPSDGGLVEEASESRRAAYTKYRQAMSALAEFLDR
jgi:hypothetical protein